MASLFSNPSTFRLSFVVIAVFLIIGPLFAKGNPRLVKNVCSHTINPSFCLKTLDSIPSTAKAADAYHLGLASLDLGIVKAATTLDVIRTFIKNHGKDTDLDGYKTCGGLYTKALGNLKLAKAEFVKHSYGTAVNNAQSAYDAAADCDDGFGHLPPQLVSNANKLVELFSEVIRHLGL